MKLLCSNPSKVTLFADNPMILTTDPPQNMFHFEHNTYTGCNIQIVVFIELKVNIIFIFYDLIIVVWKYRILLIFSAQVLFSHCFSSLVFRRQNLHSLLLINIT